MKYDIAELKNTAHQASGLDSLTTVTKSGMGKWDYQKPGEWKKLNAKSLEGLSSRQKRDAYNAYCRQLGETMHEHSGNMIKALGMTVKTVKFMPNGDIHQIFAGEKKSKLERQAEALAKLTGQDTMDLMQILAGA